MGGKGRGRGLRAKSKTELPGAAEKEEEKQKTPEEEKVEEWMAGMRVADPLSQRLPPRRRDYGQEGQLIQLIANFFEYQVPKGLQVWTYDVKLARVSEEGAVVYERFNRELSFKLFWKFVRQFSDHFPNPTMPLPRRMTYDRQKLLFSLERLPKEDQVLELKIPKAEGDLRAGNFRLSLKLATGGGGLRAIEPQTAVADDHRERDRSSLQILELLKTEHLKHNDVFFPCGRNFLYLQRSNNPNSVDLGCGRELLRGFYASDRVVEGWKFMISLDTKATPMLKPISVIDYVFEMLGRNNMPQPTAQFNPRQARDISRGLKGLKIKLSHSGFSFKCDGMSAADQTANTYKIDLGRGETVQHITLTQFYHLQHGITLKYPNWPMLMKMKQGGPNMFPLELCSIYPGQKFPNKKLTPRDHQAIIKATVVSPAQRLADIKHTAEQAQLKQGADLIDVSLSMELVRLPGRVLPHPQIEYQEGRPIVPKYGAWNMTRNRFRKGAAIPAWACITFAFPTNPGLVE